MFNVININLVHQTYGPEVSAVAISGPDSHSTKAKYVDGTVRTSGLTIPHEEIQRNSDVLALLRWRSSASDFTGRVEEISELRSWAHSVSKISAKFIVGDGGVGKTRLAAEFARELRDEQKWAAGFINLSRTDAFELRVAGTLVIIDYPEENSRAVAEFLQNLATIAADCPRLRLLFLTRQSIGSWRPLIDDSKAIGLFDMKPLRLAGIGAEDGYKIFCSAQERCAERLNTTPRPFPEELFRRWFFSKQDHQTALFIVAAAVHSAINPESTTLEFEGRDVILALVRRELSRLRLLSNEYGFPYDDFLARLTALAAVAGNLSVPRIHRLREMPIELGSNDQHLIDKLTKASILNGQEIPAPTPDILAAGIVTETFRTRPDLAPEWLWAAIEERPAVGLVRLGRISHDAEVILQQEETISSWLVQAFNRNVSRCNAVRPGMVQGALPLSLKKLDLTVWKTLADAAPHELEEAFCLNNFAFAALELGHNADIERCLNRAISIHQKYLNTDPDFSNLEIGLNYMNLTRVHEENEDYEQGATASIKCIRYLTAIKSRSIHANCLLATAYCNRGRVFARQNRIGKALTASRTSLEIFERDVGIQNIESPADYLMALRSYAITLDTGKRFAEAKSVILKAVTIARELTKGSPERFTIDLVRTLMVAATIEIHIVNEDDANTFATEAIDVVKPFAYAAPNLYGALYFSALELERGPLFTREQFLDAVKMAIEQVKVFQLLPKREREREEFLVGYAKALIISIANQRKITTLDGLVEATAEIAPELEGMLKSQDLHADVERLKLIIRELEAMSGSCSPDRD